MVWDGARRWLLGWPGLVLLLAGYYGMAVSSTAQKSHVFDEMNHLSGGYSYWAFGDYRIFPENGNLPQRLFGLPLVLSGDRFQYPSRDQALWQQSRQLPLGHQFFYRSGNDLDAMVLRGRAVAAGIGVALALLATLWSRRLFGPEGGLLTLVLCSFSPNLLAHGRLMTSDMTLSLALLGAVGGLWIALHRATPTTVLGCGVALGALQLAKFSGLGILPMGAALIAIRLWEDTPWPVALAGRRLEIRSRSGRFLACLGVIAAVSTVVVALVWACYGFRYSAFAESEPGRDQLQETWELVQNEPGLVNSAIDVAREHRLLPEAYLYGLAYVNKYSRVRRAFLDGEFRLDGWWWFFPYCVLVKTPLGLFALLALSGAAAWSRLRGAGPAALRRALLATAPLWVLFGIYWSLALRTDLNIGLRHVLPTYPVMFIFAGGAVHWIRRRQRGLAAIALLATAWFVGDSLAIRPHYLAYFNPLVGPERAYRKLVDSSLDWGQDLPGLRRWLEESGLTDGTTPVYLSYFGSADPRYHGIRARRLAGYLDWPANAGPDRAPESAFLLGGGVYAISATMLQAVYLDPPGRWTARSEDHYQRYRRIVDAVADPTLSPREQREELRRPAVVQAYRWLERLRLGRLCAYLRKREPDHQIGYSILIYRLSDEEVREALYGPAPELLPDLRLPPGFDHLGDDA